MAKEGRKEGGLEEKEREQYRTHQGTDSKGIGVGDRVWVRKHGELGQRDIDIGQ